MNATQCRFRCDMFQWNRILGVLWRKKNKGPLFSREFHSLSNWRWSPEDKQPLFVQSEQMHFNNFCWWYRYASNCDWFSFQVTCKKKNTCTVLTNVFQTKPLHKFFTFFVHRTIFHFDTYSSDQQKKKTVLVYNYKSFPDTNTGPVKSYANDGFCLHLFIVKSLSFSLGENLLSWVYLVNFCTTPCG